MFWLIAAVAITGCKTGGPPVATKKPHTLTAHGHDRVDDYYWLRDDKRAAPEVLDYLNAENDYLDAQLAHTKTLQETIFQEIKARIKEQDESVPYRLDGDWFYYRYEIGKEYKIFCRRVDAMTSPEEVILDANERAKGHDYYNVRSPVVSRGGGLMAFAEDTLSRRMYTVRIKDLSTGEVLAEEIVDTAGQVVWANDDETLFYVKREPGTLRAHQVYRHTVGADLASDVLVYEETDETFYLSIAKSRSKDYINVVSSSTLSTETRLIDADDPTAAPVVFLPREPEHEHHIEHLGDRFYIYTNWSARNFRLMSVPVDQLGDKAAWTEVIPHREDVFLNSMRVFEEHLVLEERKDGMLQLRLIRWSDGHDEYLQFDEPAYTTEIYYNPEADTAKLRFSYTSLTTPETVYEQDMHSGERVLLKRTEVLGGFQQDRYVSERLWVSARDGERVPVSLVYRKDRFKKDGSSPLYLYAYGSYGASLDPYFSVARISMLDRGFVFAMAHVRGGQEMGRRWYEDGRLLNKKNTFHDFIDCTRHLVNEGYAAKDKVFASGGSAGGLLMGAIVNMQPDLYRGVIADVPFVDVLTTMLDETIPLTTFEYDEWGNPNDKSFHDYILSYSPYDNVRAAAYPNMLVTSGLHDSQVQYWEPAKWVAKLRALKTDSNRLLMHVNMEAGHGGASGRFQRYREMALEYAFILDTLGLKR